MGALTYEYRDEMLDANGKRVSSDSLRFVQGDVHAGIQLLRAGAFSVNAHAGVVARVYAIESKRGFANDAMLANLGYLTSVGMGFNF